MNTFIKSIGALVLSFAILAPQGVFAAALNNDPQDFATLRVSNYTLNPGSSSSWGSSASASAGQTVSLGVYYHNTTTPAAKNVRIKITPQTTGNGTTHTFTATVSADNAATVFGSATITLSSSQSLSFVPGQVYWYPNQQDNAMTLPSGQTGGELFSSGVNIGDVECGWSTQGMLVAHFVVSQSSSNNLPSVTTLAATSITTNSAVLNGALNTNNTTNTTHWFEWGTTSSLGTETMRYSQNYTGNFSGSLTNLSQNTTYYYRAVAQNSAGTVHGSVLSFTTTSSGDMGTITATAQGADSISDYSARLKGSLTTDTSNPTRWFEWGTTSSLGNETAHQVQFSTGDFSQFVYGLSSNTTYYYRAVAQNSAGTIARGSILSFTTTGGAQNVLPTVTTYSPTSTYDNSATIRGYVNPNGTSDTTRWSEWGSSSSLGNVTSHVSQGSSAGEFTTTLTGLASNTTYYYRAVAQNSAGTVQGSILSFTTTGSGSSNSLPSVTTYSTSDVGESFAVLQGYVNPNGTYDTTRWFEWGTGTGLGNTTNKLSQGSGASNFSATISGLANNQTHYYRAVAQNSAGTVYGSILSFTTQTGSSSQLPFVTTSSATGVTENYATLNGYVNPNGTYNNSNNTQYWFEWGTNTNLGNSTARTYAGNVATNVSTTISGLSSNTNYYYRAVAQNSSGTVYGSVLSFNTNGGYNTPQGGVPTAITTLATNVAQSSAKINALALISGNVSTNGWFEWGTDTRLGNRTSSQFVGSAPSLAFSETLTGLSNNTTYYYRAVVDNTYGTSRGSILSFTTGGQIYYPPVVVNQPPVVTRQPPTVIVRTVVVKGVTSPIELSILGGNETVIVGETINYTVHYVNKGAVLLKDVVLRVVLPKEMQYISASRGSFSDKENTLTVPVGELKVGNSGDVTVQVRVLADTPVGKLLVTSVVLVYTDTEMNTQGDAIAYAVHTVIDGKSSNSGLGAAVGGGGFLPDTALEWLLLVVLVFMIVALVVFIQGSRRRAEEARKRTEIH